MITLMYALLTCIFLNNKDIGVNQEGKYLGKVGLQFNLIWQAIAAGAFHKKQQILKTESVFVLKLSIFKNKMSTKM